MRFKRWHIALIAIVLLFVVASLVLYFQAPVKSDTAEVAKEEQTAEEKLYYLPEIGPAPEEAEPSSQATEPAPESQPKPEPEPEPQCDPSTPFSSASRVMYFYSESCGWCQQETAILYELAPECYKVKPMNVTQHPEYIADYGITGVPTFIGNGTKYVGFRDKASLRSLLDQYK